LLESLDLKIWTDRDSILKDENFIEQITKIQASIEEQGAGIINAAPEEEPLLEASDLRNDVDTVKTVDVRVEWVLANEETFILDIPVCLKCKAVKPPRTHHCNVCNRCVMKMDQ
ncbi:hypothetical protein BB560_007020, partial [Smittium megazygosporum]